jgi:hypothetical protein
MSRNHGPNKNQETATVVNLDLKFQWSVRYDKVQKPLAVHLDLLQVAVH